jgi:UTP--glucose-1-phosphate uridylyltransferase
MKKLAQAQNFYGLRYRGRTFDTGTKLGFLLANVAYALERHDLAGPLRSELAALLER